MFSPLGLFRSLVCPEKDKCTRVPCIFSHRDGLPPPHALDLTIHLPTQARPCIVPPTPQPQPQQRLSLAPAKRPLPHTPLGNDSTIPSVAAEPPRKLQKVGSAQRPLAIPSASHTEVRRLARSKRTARMIVEDWSTYSQSSSSAIAGSDSHSAGKPFPSNLL